MPLPLQAYFIQITLRFALENINAKMISNDSKTMKVVVPSDIDNATPSIIVVDGQTMKSTTLFHLKAPVIDSITPKIAYLGQVVRIIEKGFRGPYSSMEKSAKQSRSGFSRVR